MIVAWLAGFILSFFGKTDKSKKTGIMLIITGILLVICTFASGAGVTNLLWLMGGSICYLVAGIMSCVNASRM